MEAPGGAQSCTPPGARVDRENNPEGVEQNGNLIAVKVSSTLSGLRFHFESPPVGIAATAVAAQPTAIHVGTLTGDNINPDFR